MPRVLEGKLAIVTGSSRGIGAAIAENLASKGANIVVNHTSPSSAEPAAALAARLSAAHSVKTLVIRADLGTPDGPAQLVSRLLSALAADHPRNALGNPQIDILVNNAGVAINNKIADLSAADFQRTYAVNVQGPLLLVQAVAPYLPTDRSGRLVSLSSISASTGFVGQSVYGGTKAAVEAMTRTWARELAERCTANAVNPGPVEGPMYAANTDEFKAGIRGWIEHAPLMRARPGVDSDEVVEDAKTSGGRPAYASEVAGIVGMVCTPDAAWCTGQVVSANGGMLMF
ncbi:uncharacterized protein E0L32_002392 [Thyridium curvatum]|uniref:Ketoreductase domain-containing protein n=1 Tax=Thyridium curvatum TaxID=1093900 RepID=A0A507AKM8_9PEZI|nr:uncharacterized protein E0L32_002392 [Thyridium curvatum]TPX06896.1 hypothetical protein E0L32_002392 [Thyridium curvatum]